MFLNLHQLASVNTELMSYFLFVFYRFCRPVEAAAEGIRCLQCQPSTPGTQLRAAQKAGGEA